MNRVSARAGLLLAALTVLPTWCPARPAAGTARGGEDSSQGQAEIRILVADLGSDQRAKFLAARDALWAKPPELIVRYTPDLLAGIKADRSSSDVHRAIAGLFGPDCGGAVPALAQAISEEKDPGRRKTLVGFLGLFGVAARDQSLPLLSRIGQNDPDGAVRQAANETAERVNVPDAKLQEVLRTLQKRQFDTSEELDAVYQAIQWVTVHWGVRPDIICEMMRLKLFADGNKRKAPFGGELDDFFMQNPAAMRIGGAALAEAVEGSDGKLRNQALELLAAYSRSKLPCAWPSGGILSKLLASRKPEVRRSVIETISRIRRAVPADALSEHPVCQLILPLQRMGVEETDQAVVKALMEALKAFEEKQLR